MKKRFAIAFLLGYSYIGASGQIDESFLNDLSRLSKSDLTLVELQRLVHTYSHYLTPFSSATKTAAIFRQIEVKDFPLEELRKQTDYKRNVRKLLHSRNANKRTLGYLVVASANDRRYERLMLANLKTEQKSVSVWLAHSLLYLKSNHAAELFEFCVERGFDFTIQTLPLFEPLNVDSLQRTAIRAINSRDSVARVSGVYLLSITPNTPNSEACLRAALKNWPLRLQGHVIYAMMKQGVGQLIGDLTALTSKAPTQAIAYRALADSPDENDRRFVREIAANSRELSSSLLNCFFLSRHVENVRYWLFLLDCKKLPSDYSFVISDQPLLKKDELLPSVHRTLLNLKDARLCRALLTALDGRSDSLSKKILTDFLVDDDESLRSAAAKVLSTVKLDEKVVIQVVNCLTSERKRTPPLTEILIKNQIDTLQGHFENIYKTMPSNSWRDSAIKYLSTYSKPENRILFQSILSDFESTTLTQRRYAALGLASLNDAASVNLIADACYRESLNNDLNCADFLRALSMLKGDRARQVVSSFSHSQEQAIRHLANQLLSHWD